MNFEDFKNIVHSEPYERDSIIYTVYVTYVDNQYCGWWFCETCNVNSDTTPSKPSDTIEKAIIDAKTHTGGHHWSKHHQST